MASIRAYDALLISKPSYSPSYIHKTVECKRVSFQTWDWDSECYNLTQYIIDDESSLTVNKFNCKYRATTREKLGGLRYKNGCKEVRWLLPAESEFYQPVVVTKK